MRAFGGSLNSRVRGNNKLPLREVAVGWNTSNRRGRLPSNWSSLRREILRRDGYRCQIAFAGCKGVATDVDHIARGDNHSVDNLRAACSECHKKKTSAEAQEARRIKAARRFRPIERHPGER